MRTLQNEPFEGRRHALPSRRNGMEDHVGAGTIRTQVSKTEKRAAMDLPNLHSDYSSITL